MAEAVEQLDLLLGVAAHRVVGRPVADALPLFANQLCLVYSLKPGQASTLSLVFGTTPVFTGFLALLLRLERLQRSFWIGAALTVAGVAFVGVGAGSGASAGLAGFIL